MNENNELVKHFLNSTFFKAWKSDKTKPIPDKYNNFTRFELDITATCDLACKYCYYNKYSEIGPHGQIGLNPNKISTKKNVLNNLDILLNWLKENEYYPYFDMFSGEIFHTELGFKVLEKCIQFYIDNNVKGHQIVIPTNMSFTSNKQKRDRVERLIKLCHDNGNALFLSASIDGKYCEDNRPFKLEKNKNNRDYDQIFKFAHKYNIKFHPMLYYDKIEKWEDNFLWFQEQFIKYGIPWDAIYLLEVRNDGWTPTSIKHLQNFIYFLIKWTYNKLGNPDPKTFINMIINNSPLFNIFSCLSTIGRGIGCSIQSSVQVRLGDLTVAPCHRNFYDSLKTWRFIVENNKIIDIESLNHELMIAVYTTNTKNFPYCQDCLIKHLCLGGCLGSQYESMQDPFIPIPSVCLLEHGKVEAILKGLEELGCINDLIEYLPSKKSTSIINFLNNLNRRI